ncbi:synaptosomal-associated protein 29 [Sitodiplosis mosellana]|uniref:synaptosomal-associated protein 29 n=1 Tax=Sitodiplosis mosellana TaxID=263140 RepID=UPI0024440CF7|nr:synaptosomal-associated protein 29 [Sitodiplosis mosellana]
MSGHKYTANSANLFDDDDIDDETFLKNSSRSRNTNPFDDQQLSYQERTRAIEERTLASSHRSLGLLYETEQVGIATAEELARQREQLENTNKHLDDINQTLRFSQKHLNGLKSIFGGLKNYIAGQKDMQPPSQTAPKPNIGDKLNSPSSSYSKSVQSFSNIQGATAQADNAFHHSQSSIAGVGSHFNKQLDKNLDEMAGSLSRLKGLAVDLHQEIDDQNDLIDDITTKVENVDAKVGKQNKEMNRLLGKK